MFRTRRIFALASAAVMAASFSGQALAQAETGTGGSPGSTVTAPNTSRVGRTMPPTTAAGAATNDDRRMRTQNEKHDDQLMRGICIGCSAQ